MSQVLIFNELKNAVIDFFSFLEFKPLPRIQDMKEEFARDKERLLEAQRVLERRVADADHKCTQKDHVLESKMHAFSEKESALRENVALIQVSQY